MNGKTPAFVSLHKLLNSLFRELYSAGIGTTRHRYETLSEESMRKNCGQVVSSVFEPDSMRREEHQKLKLSQVSFKEVPNPKEPTTTVESVSYMSMALRTGVVEYIS